VYSENVRDWTVAKVMGGMGKRGEGNGNGGLVRMRRVW
jgi:hypothetical protein